MAIRWTRSDYITLGKAISAFNKKVKELEKETDGLNLPELQDYEMRKKNIITRNELNRYIKSLKRFQRQTQQQRILLESGENLTKWEYSELKKARKRIQRNIENEMQEYEQPDESGFSRAQMGSTRYRELKRELESLDKFEKRSKDEHFNEQRESILRRGTLDYLNKKQIQYKENFLKMFEEFKNYDGYEEFKNKIEKLNPKEFYNFINLQQDLVEIKYWYNVKNGRVVPRAFTSQEYFSVLLKRYSLEKDE